MKIICSIVMSFIFLNQVLSQPIFETKNKQIIIKQNVRSQTNWDYNFIKDEPSSEGNKTSFTRYNSRGDIVEFVTYKSRDTLTYETYEYNNEGYRIDYTKHKGGKKNISYRKISDYDNNGYLILEQGFDGSEKFKNTYVYNDDGKLKEINYQTDNSLNEKRVFEHNDNITNVTVYNSADAVTSYMSLRYDKKDNLIEETQFDENKNPIENRIFVYNNESKVVSEVKYREGNFYYKLTYLYDSAGELINIDEENLEHSRFIKKNFIYNDKGFLVEMNWRRKPGEEFNTRNYAYDDKGLCTQVLTYYPSTKFKVLTKYEYEFY
jgi:hypothetical protein